MKKLTGLIVFLAALFSIYTAYWFYQANHLKKVALYHVEQYSKPNEKGYQFKVDDVSVGGYPFHYVINLKNPAYEKTASTDDEPSNLKFFMNGVFKIGTDIFGRSYWVKQEGDLNYVLPGEDSSDKNFVTKGNLELKMDVAHPQYGRAFLHPFKGLPQIFYKEDVSFQEVLNEIKMASYEDRDFVIYEVENGVQKPLASFDKGIISWVHGPKGSEDEKYAFHLDVKDFEVKDNGQPLLPHLKRLMDLDTDPMNVPYIFHSGKNNFSIDFESLLPKDFEIEKFFRYKNIEIALKNFEMDNMYGETSLKFNLNLTEKTKEDRNLNVGFNAESQITEKGSKAIHQQFIDSIKQNVAEKPEDPENKVLIDLLQCCQDRLQDIIPDYTKLGKMQLTFDSNSHIKNVLQDPTLHQIIINHLDANTEPYSIKTHGVAEFSNDQPRGKYEIEWVNYKVMIHDIVAYFNRIHPIFEKFAEANKQPFPVGIINPTKEKEIEDFFRSISNDPTTNDESITITLDFSDPNNPKIGSNTVEQVKQAWEKLAADLMKPEASKPTETPKVPEKPQVEQPVPDVK